MSNNKEKSYRKENQEATIRKQKECSAKALQVVERLIESDVSEELLLQSLHYINQASYQDVIDERSIIHLCGYPVCYNELKNIPKHQYKITRSNGTLLVYDTTERKKFCSNVCYKAAKYLKDQLPSCPLWLIQQKDTDSIKLITADCKSGGSLGEQITFSSTREEAPGQHYGLFLSSNENNSQKINPNESINEIQKSTENDDVKRNRTSDDKVVGSNETFDSDDDNQEYEDAVDSDLSLFDETSENTSFNNVNNSDEVFNKDFTSTNKIKDKKQSDVEIFYDANNICTASIINPNVCDNSVPNEFDKCVSVIALGINDELKIESCNVNKVNNFGIGDIEKECSSNSKNTDNILSDESSNNPSETTRINDLSDNRIIENKPKNKHRLKKSKHRNKPKGPSDVSPMLAAVLRTERCIREWISLDTLLLLLGEDKLKTIIEETCGLEKFRNQTQNTMQDPVVYERYIDICKKLNLLELHESKLDSNFKSESSSAVGPTKPVPDFESLRKEATEMEIKVRSFYRGDKQVQFNEESCSADKGDAESVAIPLVDQHAQKALRRRILLDHLNRVLPDLLRALGLSRYSNSITSEVKRLVETFTLSAHNVMFRPAEWNFVAIVIIKLLSVHDDVLNQILSMERADKYLTLMLMSYEQDSGYLNRIITWLLYEHTLFIS